MMVRFRCGVVSTLSTVGLLGVARTVGPTLRGIGADPDTTVSAICAAALMLALTWGWAAIQAGVLEAWRRGSGGGHAATVGSVGGVRRWVLAACGVAVTGVLAAPVAQAATPATVPEPATTEQATVVVAAPLVPRVVTDRIVVRPGDCLWSLAAAEVQPGAGPATVTARWRAIYRANRDVIGSDPDLIRPGQHLRRPR